MKFKFNIKSRLSEYKRIIKIARKPSMEEFKRVSYITAISTLIIGFAGFVIELFMQLIGGNI